MNFKSVEKSSAAAADLMRLSSVMDPEEIAFRLIINGKQHTSPVLKHVLVKTEDADLALVELLAQLEESLW